MPWNGIMQYTAIYCNIYEDDNYIAALKIYTELHRNEM